MSVSAVATGQTAESCEGFGRGRKDAAGPEYLDAAARPNIGCAWYGRDEIDTQGPEKWTVKTGERKQLQQQPQRIKERLGMKEQWP